MLEELKQTIKDRLGSVEYYDPRNRIMILPAEKAGKIIDDIFNELEEDSELEFKTINDPKVLSFLYDQGLMPEQCQTSRERRAIGVIDQILHHEESVCPECKGEGRICGDSDGIGCHYGLCEDCDKSEDRCSFAVCPTCHGTGKVTEEEEK